jgi:hypothetical protein
LRKALQNKKKKHRTATKKKLSPRQKQRYEEVVGGLVANCNDRVAEKAQFLGKIQPFLDALNGKQKVWLFYELGKFKCGEIET